MHRIGVTSVAVGIESEAEANVCATLGFQLAQGFYFGKPQLFTSLLSGATEGQPEAAGSEPDPAPTA